MQLDGALFEKLAAALNAGNGEAVPASAPASAPAPQATDSRRRERRLDVHARATIIPLTDSLAAAPFDVSLRDLSAGGIGFLHSERIRLDEQFVVLLPGGGRDSLAILCQVSHYQPLADRLYSVGAEFTRVLRQPAADEALALPVAQPPAAARRAAS